MTDLTQDWKNGKLPDGWYYVQFPGGEIKIYSFYDLCYFRLTFYSDKIKILAEVPDYTTWQNVLKTAEMEHKANNRLLEDVERLERQVNHLSKTQARQFIDNQKLQVRAEKAKDVIDITTAKKIKQLKELLKDLQSEAIDALTAIQNDCESDDFSIFIYPEVQTFYTLSEKIDEELKNDRKCNDNL